MSATNRTTHPDRPTEPLHPGHFAAPPHVQALRAKAASSAAPGYSVRTQRTCAIAPDGNCLSRAIALLIYGKQDAFSLVRQELVEELCLPERAEALDELILHEGILGPDGSVVQNLPENKEQAHAAALRFLRQSNNWWDAVALQHLARIYSCRFAVWLCYEGHNGQSLPTYQVFEGGPAGSPIYGICLLNRTHFEILYEC